jgi:transposase InsO family protein
LLRWHGALFHFYWRHKSKNKKREPRIDQETIDLIKQMVQENRLWGAERIRGELLKLGIEVSKRTIQKYMARVRERSSGQQTWATFLKNHAKDMWSCDFTVVHELFFRPLYIFVIIELQTRQIVHTAVTRSPSDEWTRQQLREATAWGKKPKYLIRDRDNKYGPLFSKLAESSGIRELKTPIRAPRANAVCERFIGSLRRECLDYRLILHSAQLRRVVGEYVDYYNRSRPHQGIEQRIPAHYHQPNQPSASGKIIAWPILGGLHHAYSRSAYLH